METLESMFPNVEYETLEIVLESQEGDLEAAIDAMLQMCKDSEEVPSSSEASQPRRAVVSGFKGARPAVPVPVSVPDDPFAEPRNPVIERDDQIRADEMLARSMQQQIISDALQEQTPTCFTPITGMLSGYRGSSSQLASSATAAAATNNESSAYSQMPTTLSGTVSNVWNAVSTIGQTVTQTIVDTAQNWMSPEDGAEEENEERREREEGTLPPGQITDGIHGLRDGQHTNSNSFAYSAGTSSVSQRRKTRESKKSD